jgi:hypothetical protein
VRIDRAVQELVEVRGREGDAVPRHALATRHQVHPPEHERGARRQLADLHRDAVQARAVLAVAVVNPDAIPVALEQTVQRRDRVVVEDQVAGDLGADHQDALALALDPERVEIVDRPVRQEPQPRDRHGDLLLAVGLDEGGSVTSDGVASDSVASAHGQIELAGVEGNRVGHVALGSAGSVGFGGAAGSSSWGHGGAPALGP